MIEDRQKELLGLLEKHWRLEQRLEEFDEGLQPSELPGGYKFTPRQELEAKRTLIVQSFFDKEGALSTRRSRTNYEATNKDLRATCVVSKRFERDDMAYWYALHPNWIEFMKGARHAWR